MLGVGAYTPPDPCTPHGRATRARGGAGGRASRQRARVRRDDGDEERGGVGEEVDDASGSPRQVIVDCDDARRANYLVGTTDLPAGDSSAEPGHHPVTRSGPI